MLPSLSLIDWNRILCVYDEKNMFTEISEWKDKFSFFFLFVLYYIYDNIDINLVYEDIRE
jgi:hypothetical protein